MSKKTVMVTLACLMSAGILFCGCDDKKQPEGEKPDPAKIKEDAGKAAENAPTPTGCPDVSIAYC